MKYILTLILLLSFVLTNSQNVSELDSNGNLIVDNEVFLPIGFYSEGLFLDGYPNIPQVMDDAGFNTIYTESAIGEIEDYQPFLDDCESLGLKNILGLPYSFIDPQDFDFYVNEFKDSPSVIAWNILDDANNLTLNDLQTQRQNLIQIDDTRVASASWYNDLPPFSSMVPFVELVGMQAYPWEDSSSNDLVFVDALWRSTALEAKGLNKFAFATPQAFNWDDATYPPAAHLDCQTYIGFITGLKGVIFYTYKDYDTNSTIDITQPEIFQTASQIAQEILETEWKEVILFGDHEYVNIDFYRYYATWRYNGYLYLIAVNADDELSYNYSIELPSDIVGEATNFFSYRPDSLTINNGNLTGTLDPYQVAIYRMETESLAVEENLSLELTLYPNPSDGILNINSSVPNLSFYLYDVTGKVLKKDKMNDFSMQVNLSDFSKGIYFVEFYNDKKTVKTTRKIIKQ